MSWLTDLLAEFPALSVAKERLALVEDRLRDAEQKNEELSEENAELKRQLAGFQKTNQFIEIRGVLWKEFDGVVDAIAYCPVCKLAMSEFPPRSDEMLICSKCNFRAPFLPSEADSIAKKIETDLLLL